MTCDFQGNIVDFAHPNRGRRTPFSVDTDCTLRGEVMSRGRSAGTSVFRSQLQTSTCSCQVGGGLPMKMRFMSGLVLLLAMLALVTTMVQAQVTTSGRLTGVVIDASGALIPKA